ncbi:cytochrome c oxidase subunit II [Microbacterium sp. EYE_5]|uniref:aa3-type cytochrome oxidase subunit II n=1 Tax=unclassified Microbacterium TaxID=2609290 RepID=UPI0020029ED2|nr:MULTISPECIES: cytochrome c oxidase subunit II [unclassified Microbacterium]MCK6080467.1 cytochrome c oxidase subunit II [Microbacterium sp. EYE_382]MCK6085738.1 cytochrome c oxidase subunit II [Microbacterium sp. EYE_384]MCK6124764.1 cytochrome c oxidase subunit II [Microbacterium sp. EYE_80]MCK6127673.1 cytochrome c oxidase subunit II [Microbacterium sp. EYE_79]MCK6141422.1 cytochrome c oxidase subunit II [Microbacterium sp. EYE_39]
MRVNRRLRWVALPLAIASAVALAACSPTTANGFLPGFDEEGGQATNHTSMIAGLWTTSWIVVLAVGVITWALMGWAAIAYRRRKGQSGLPVQLRYNMPIEMFFTIAPVILVLGFFAFTARDQAIIETQHENPDVCITAIGKQWAWDFQYNGNSCEETDDAVWTMGVQAQTDAEGNITNEIPELVLPVNQEVTLQLESRDVIHSFWIIDFLYKKDMYPGRDNYWSFIPTKEGEYTGKCAELCGQYHSMMLFNVKVVSEAEYADYIASLEAAGQTGDIDDAYDRLQNAPGTGAADAEGESN